MFSYSFWTLFGGLGGLLYHNGLAIVLNKFFPPSLLPSVKASNTIGHIVSDRIYTYCMAKNSAGVCSLILPYNARGVPVYEACREF